MESKTDWLGGIKWFCWMVIFFNMVIGVWMKFGPGYDGFHWILVEGRMAFSWACFAIIIGIWAYDKWVRAERWKEEAHAGKET